MKMDTSLGGKSVKPISIRGIDSYLSVRKPKFVDCVTYAAQSFDICRAISRQLSRNRKDAVLYVSFLLRSYPL